MFENGSKSSILIQDDSKRYRIFYFKRTDGISWRYIDYEMDGKVDVISIGDETNKEFMVRKEWTFVKAKRRYEEGNGITYEVELGGSLERIHFPLE